MRATCDGIGRKDSAGGAVNSTIPEARARILSSMPAGSGIARWGSENLTVFGLGTLGLGAGFVELPDTAGSCEACEACGVARGTSCCVMIYGPGGGPTPSGRGNSEPEKGVIILRSRFKTGLLARGGAPGHRIASPLNIARLWLPH